MTEEQLIQKLWLVKFIPKIIVGPGHLIRTFEGYNDPYPDHYRGAPVVVHDGWGERCEVVPLDYWPT